MAYELKRGDTRPLFVVALKDDYGEATEAAVDLTTAGGAFFNMRDQTTSVVKVSRGSATITNGTAGEVTYSWAEADTDTAGTFDAEIEIDWGDGRAETFPSGPGGGTYWTILISEDIA